MTPLTDAARATADRLATRRCECPHVDEGTGVLCGLAIEAPPDTSAQEFACDACGATLRLEPTGVVREIVCRGVVVNLEAL